ncbi:colicin immunity domain-containing protein [Pseudomonas entomophila]|uniref:colicin immunity domain-containing protein n=1 Tax=Pseudomonas entomophila TaxID=312306 RepID=UPI0024062199|nr:colicin immunity domain-containing protein [Pseudomonas entomophila]MDF9617964.1 colicin immunity domain-containing protein [Pseudomonas entomophila]
MSQTLLEFVKSFMRNRLSATAFSEAYMELWKIERDSKALLKDSTALSECLSSIFCAADMYCEDAELRDEHEFDQEKLRCEIARFLRTLDSMSTNNR